ncbi:tetratricopeptide repeat protein [Janthinobacterium sp. 64]|uniref:tetratricopeptide repeat protein n=1 Tax=Janthinobacterium sp. 64 TaxID=2035208 RepID=UPI000C2B790B|nr:tetratricopeptide repeat protein [Janthinobacterium sp. 64]PKB20776.1 Sel1 repeat-containing protein [Janthinobacterium sp. 64]
MMLANLLLAAALASPVVAAPDVTARAKVLMRAGTASQPQARALFEQAAGQGSGPAAYYLGLMLKNGMGGPQDGAAALRWLELAAQRGVAPAMFIVANMLLTSDEVRARYWLDAACDLGYPEALQQKSVALSEGQMGYAHNEEQGNLYLKMATHAMGHRPPEP